MRKWRALTSDSKRQILEELLYGVNAPAQLARRHEISSGLLYHLKKKYAKGGFGNEASCNAQGEDVYLWEHRTFDDVPNEFPVASISCIIKKTVALLIELLTSE